MFRYKIINNFHKAWAISKAPKFLYSEFKLVLDYIYDAMCYVVLDLVQANSDKGMNLSDLISYYEDSLSTNNLELLRASDVYLTSAMEASFYSEEDINVVNNLMSRLAGYLGCKRDWDNPESEMVLMVGIYHDGVFNYTSKCVPCE